LFLPLGLPKNADQPHTDGQIANRKLKNGGLFLTKTITAIHTMTAKASFNQTVNVLEIVIQNGWFPTHKIIYKSFSVARNKDEFSLKYASASMRQLLKIHKQSGISTKIEEDMLWAQKSAPCEMKEMTKAIEKDAALLQLKMDLYNENCSDCDRLRDYAVDLFNRIENSFELAYDLHRLHIFECIAAFGGDEQEARRWIEDNLIEPYLVSDPEGWFN
jgi:hypothetical protein